MSIKKFLSKTFIYDKDGVPVLTDSFIEDVAIKLITIFKPVLLIHPDRFPMGELFDFLKKNFELKISIIQIVNSTISEKTLGITHLSKKHIYIDESIVNNDPFFLFTSAHEIGHWLFHTHKPIINNHNEIYELHDIERDIFGKKKLQSSLDWIEHHANIFSGFLLMPKDSFLKALLEVQDKMGIKRNRGKILLYKNESYFRDFKTTISLLQKIYSVSKESIKIRIEQLNLLEKDKNVNFWDY